MKNIFSVNERVVLLDFLSERIGGVSLASFKKLLKAREIKVNGNRITQNIVLSEGDSVEIFIPSIMIANALSIEYEDDNILVVDKPPLVTVEGGLTEQLKGRYSFIAPIHRLDRNTTGLVLFAKNKEAEEILLGAFKKRTVNKKYRALVSGKLASKEYRAYIFKDAKKNISYVSDASKVGYKEIITGVQLIKSYGDVSEVELSLITGRTHQLRAHLAHLNCPILGDDKYGDRAINKAFNLKMQQLTATSIELCDLSPPLEYLNGKTIRKNASFDKKLIQKLMGCLNN